MVIGSALKKFNALQRGVFEFLVLCGEKGWTNRGWRQGSFNILKGVVFLSLSPLKCKQEVDSMDEPTL